MSGDPAEERARATLAEAVKKVKESEKFLTNLFGSSPAKLEEAADLYGKAGNNFKMCKNWVASGSAFSEAANIHAKLGSRHDAASAYCEAANSYRKSDPNLAVDILQKAIEIYTDMGRFSIAAKHHITIAEIYETDLAKSDEAIKHYDRAADYYRGEESNSSANKCSLKVAMLTCTLDPPDYDKAAKIFDMLGTSAMDNTLLKYSAKDYFFKAVLCQLNIDLINGQNAVAKYSDICPSFADSRECKLLNKLIMTMETDNAEDYAKAVAEYDSISRLDQWHTAILLRIKKQLNEDEDLK